MTSFFDKQNNICSDSCWEEAKNYGNNKINSYYTYSTQLIDCETPNVRMPEFIYDHVNLRGRPGYGVADACLIDNYSKMINNVDGVTRDRCKLQLFKRLFNAPPLFKGQCGDINVELEILSGNDSGFIGSSGGTSVNNSYGCKKTIMEQQIRHPIPLIDCMKDIQNPEHIVPIWTNGGEDTRSYINRLNFNRNN
jgi:hypothetical protein